MKRFRDLITEASADGIIRSSDNITAEHKDPFGNIIYLTVNTRTKKVFSYNRTGTPLSLTNIMYMMPPRQAFSGEKPYTEQLVDRIQKEVVRGNKSLAAVVSDFTKLKWKEVKK